jgi:hypothetical protein
MLHIPRSLAPTSTLNAAALPRAPLRSTAERPPVPYMGSAKTEPNLAASPRRNPMITRLNMERWDVDPLKIYLHITGRG